MKASWKTDHREFRTTLRQFHDKVAQLAHEMFETDDAGELPIYVRITDRTAFRQKDEIVDDKPLDIGLSLAEKRLIRKIEEQQCVSA